MVIDVANTETTRMADFVLPAQSQFEKWEASFFTLEFPHNYFHLRKPVITPKSDTLPEPEIYKRLMIEMGGFPERFPLLEKISKLHRHYPFLGMLPVSLLLYFKIYPKLKKQVLMILYDTLGKALPEDSNNAAMLWGASLLYAKKYRKAVLRTGLKGKGNQLGEALFEKILTSKSGLKISSHRYEEVWDLVEHPDKKIMLCIPELLAGINKLMNLKQGYTNREFPFVLAAGERRSYNANQIYRDPEWRKKDQNGAMKINPEDAEALHIENGSSVLCRSKENSIEVIAEIDDSMQVGCLSLPHGYGFDYIEKVKSGKLQQNGPRINRLTSTRHCDPLTKTPYHKYVAVNLMTVEKQVID